MVGCWVPAEAAVEAAAKVGAEEPDPRIFTHALQIGDAGPDRWMVGDNPIADIDGALPAGIRAILADGAYPDSRWVTVLESRQIVGGLESRAGG